MTEAGIDRGEEFGEERLAEALSVHQGQPAIDLAQSVVDAVSRFSGASRSDDVTVVALRGI